jgi:hypothetical protein
METSVEELGKRVDRLNALASKGVHAEVTEFEVNLCVLQTYALAGDLLRLLDATSAALSPAAAAADSDPPATPSSAPLPR